MRRSERSILSDPIKYNALRAALPGLRKFGYTYVQTSRFNKMVFHSTEVNIWFKNISEESWQNIRINGLQYKLSKLGAIL